MDAKETAGADSMGSCTACPHCGKPIYLAASGGEAQAAPESGDSWENDLRHTMSPQNSGNEEAA